MLATLITTAPSAALDSLGFVHEGPLAGQHQLHAELILTGDQSLSSVDGQGTSTVLAFSAADNTWTVRHAGEGACVADDLDEAAAVYRRLAGVR